MNCNNNLDVQLSKTLSWLLRHGTKKEGLNISPDGFVSIAQILEHKSLKNKFNVQDILRVVENNDKKRFSLKKNDDLIEIRANQGHSIEGIDNLGLASITLTSGIKTVIHGTYYKYWKSIKSEGLSRMRRNHIHFAKGLPNDKTVISGMRKNSELHIFIDLDKALGDGLQFFISTNEIILSPGNQFGVIEPKYFLKVIDTQNGIHLVI